MPLMHATIDVVVAVYLLVWAVRRKRRDKPLVLLVGVVLLVCAGFLAVVAWPAAEPAHQLPPLEPSTPLV